MESIKWYYWYIEYKTAIVDPGSVPSESKSIYFKINIIIIIIRIYSLIYYPKIHCINVRYIEYIEYIIESIIYSIFYFILFPIRQLDLFGSVLFCLFCFFQFQLKIPFFIDWFSIFIELFSLLFYHLILYTSWWAVGWVNLCVCFAKTITITNQPDNET